MNADRRPLFVRAASTPNGLSRVGLARLAKLTKAYGSRTAALDAVERLGSTTAALAAVGVTLDAADRYGAVLDHVEPAAD